MEICHGIMETVVIISGLWERAGVSFGFVHWGVDSPLSVISDGFFFQPRSSQRALLPTGRTPDANGPLTFPSAASLRPRGDDVFKDWRWQRERRKVEGIDRCHPLHLFISDQYWERLDERLVWSDVYRVANLLWDPPVRRKNEMNMNI